MRMTPKHTDARYIEFLNKFLKSFDKCVYGPDTLTAYGAGWQDCQNIILDIIKDAKYIDGIEIFYQENEDRFKGMVKSIEKL